MAWRRRQGRIEIDGASLLKFILFCFGTISTMYFWVIFGLTVQWLIFFKRQKTVYQLLPTPSQEQLFLELAGVTIAFKIIDLLHMLWSQISFEIFFVDWERPQGRVNQPLQGGEAGAMDAPVSIWRTLFIANEWNEIQTIRKINPELQIFLVLLFLKVLGFEYLATTDPQGATTVNPTMDYVGEYSKVLRFAILSIVFLSVEAVQWFFFAFIYERFVGDALGDFIDLCSMSNVSIFILEVSENIMNHSQTPSCNHFSKVTKHLLSGHMGNSSPYATTVKIGGNRQEEFRNEIIEKNTPKNLFLGQFFTFF